jgi:hypothetical protein
MMEEERRFENIIRNLKQQKPVLQSDRALTDEIMLQLNSLNIKKSNKWIYFVQRCSAVVSILFIGLFIYQINKPVAMDDFWKKTPAKQETHRIELKIEHFSVNQDNIRQIVKLYCDYISANVKENNTLYQLKNNINYESNP